MKEIRESMLTAESFFAQIYRFTPLPLRKLGK
jgi:hypothetical protein